MLERVSTQELASRKSINTYRLDFEAQWSLSLCLAHSLSSLVSQQLQTIDWALFNLLYRLIIPTTHRVTHAQHRRPLDYADWPHVQVTLRPYWTAGIKACQVGCETHSLRTWREEYPWWSGLERWCLSEVDFERRGREDIKSGKMIERLKSVGKKILTWNSS